MSLTVTGGVGGRSANNGGSGGAGGIASLTGTNFLVLSKERKNIKIKMQMSMYM